MGLLPVPWLDPLGPLLEGIPPEHRACARPLSFFFFFHLCSLVPGASPNSQYGSV